MDWIANNSGFLITVLVLIILICIAIKLQKSKQVITNIQTESKKPINNVSDNYDSHIQKAIKSADNMRFWSYCVGGLHILGGFALFVIYLKKYAIISIISLICCSIFSIIWFALGSYLYYNLTTKAYIMKFTKSLECK